MFIRREDVFTAEDIGVGKKTPITAYRIIHRNAIPLPDNIVVLSMARGSMHGSGTGLCCHVVTQNQGDLAWVERVR